MSKLKTLASALGYAHLLGLAPAAARVDDDKDDKKNPDADDGDDGDDAKADDAGKDDKKDAKADDGQEPDDEKNESKAKSKAGADDGDDEDDSDKEKAARLSERARCAAIFASPAAATRPDMAAHLAFNTGMSSKAAVEMLGAIAAGGAAPRSLASRMASTTIPNVGASAPAGKPTGTASAAQMIIDAGKKRRGEK